MNRLGIVALLALFLPVASGLHLTGTDADEVATTSTSSTVCGASSSGRYTSGSIGTDYVLVEAIGGGGTEARGYVYSPSTSTTYTMWTVDQSGALSDYGFDAQLMRHENLTASNFLVEVKFTLNNVWGATYTHITVGCNAVGSANVGASGSGGTINGYDTAGSSGKLWTYTRTSVTGDIGYLYDGSLDPAVSDSPEPTTQRNPIFGDNGTIYGGNKTEVAGAFKISETSLGALWGMIFIVGLAITGYGLFRELGAAVGGVAGLGFSVVLDFIPAWFVALVGVSLAAGFLLIRGRGE